MKKLTTLIMISSMGLVAAGSAAAAGPLVGGYAGKAGSAVGSVLGSNKAPNPHTTAHTGTLPFTGVNLAAFAVFALVLLLLGVVMVRAGRRDQSKQ
jgi:hypothetical protein